MRTLLRALSLLPLLALGCCAPAVPQKTATPATATVPAAERKEPKLLHGGGILVVYPRDDSVVKAPSTFLIGSVPRGSTLSSNGAAVRVNDQGYFAHVVPLQSGTNSFTLVRDGKPDQALVLQVQREPQPAPLAPGPLKIMADSIEPRQDVGVTAGDTVAFAVRATPGGQVDVIVGARRVRLRPASGKDAAESVNRGLDAAYGEVYQRYPRLPSDLYCGFYKVSPSDRWNGVRPRFLLTKNKASLTLTAPARLTTVEQPATWHCLHDETVVRLGPGQARTTPLPAGVRLSVDGWVGRWMRCAVAPGRHLWIAREDLSSTGEPPLEPSSPVRTVNVKSRPDGARVIVPLQQRLPFQIEQQLNPNRLALRIFGVTSDTDWITQSPDPAEESPVDHAVWKQCGDRTYELLVNLRGHRQWGYRAGYEGTNLVLHVNKPPPIKPGEDGLAGATICVDPGHGGSETGAIGPSGVEESRINLSIALRLKEMLERQGARVVMTRQTEDEEPGLSDRVRIAERAGACMLVSVHNNALPDGRDPWKEHGTSTYWYHPQAIELARTLKDALVAELGFPDFGAMYQNLALTRPAAMPAVLVEVGFMIHPDEYARLLEEQVQERAAAAIARGITAYLRPPR